MAVCGGDADVVTGPARFPQQDRLAGPNAEAALQMAGQRAGDRHRPVLDGVPGGILMTASSPFSVGTLILAPRVAAAKLMGTSQTRSLPLRVKVGCGATWIST